MKPQNLLTLRAPTWVKSLLTEVHFQRCTFSGAKSLMFYRGAFFASIFFSLQKKRHFTVSWSCLNNGCKATEQSKSRTYFTTARRTFEGFFFVRDEVAFVSQRWYKLACKFKGLDRANNLTQREDYIGSKAAERNFTPNEIAIYLLLLQFLYNAFFYVLLQGAFINFINFIIKCTFLFYFFFSDAIVNFIFDMLFFRFPLFF